VISAPMSIGLSFTNLLKPVISGINKKPFIMVELFG
jgi:hypothetical protein